MERFMKIGNMILSTISNAESVILNKTKKSMKWSSNRSLLLMERVSHLPSM